MPVAGARLGPYEIVAPLGVGGMGEVYRARDTRLGRTVAIKVLAPQLAAEPEFRARFDREAKAIATLNHPHICTLHDVGHEQGTDFLVMEYLEGETLAARLAKGALPVDQAIQRGIEIADALEKAHRVGIVHRDLKPSNIMLTKAGAKLLDFGLAKAGRPPAAAGTAASMPATATAPLTAKGSFLGSLNYMSPEQLEGKDVDARGDLFAFGAVLYEMVSGQKAFDGTSPASVIAAILDNNPAPLARVQPLAPPALEHVVAGCLVKDPDERWQAAADVKRELQWIAEGAGGDSRPTPVRTRAVIYGSWAFAGMAAGVALAAFILSSRSEGDRARTLSARFDIRLDDGWELYSSPAISPDGRRVAYSAARRDGTRHLFMRTIDALDAVRVPGTEDAFLPFFSPDSQWIGFFTWTALNKVPVAGGAPIAIAETTRVVRGATWGADGTIVFSATPHSGLQRVSDSGGSVQALTTLRPENREVGHVFPAMLPGAEAVLFTITNADRMDDSKIAARSLQNSQQRVLIDGGRYAQYAASGHLVYARGDSLMAVPFDARTLEVRGQPVRLLEGVAGSSMSGAALFSLSASGALAYAEGQDAKGGLSTPHWVGANSRQEPLPNAPPGLHFDASISPDGKYVAVSVVGSNQDIWLHDIARATWTRVTHDAATDMAPVWTENGTRIVFSSGTDEGVDLFWVAADGVAQPKPLFANTRAKYATSWSAVHRRLAFIEIGEGTREDVWLLDPSNPAKPELFLRTSFAESAPVFSPSGRWLAYESDETGRREIYVRPLRSSGRKYQISTEGGRYPRWSPAGDEILFLNGNRVMVVAVSTGSDLDPKQPRLKLTAADQYAGLSANYDVAPDGRRLLMMQREPPPPPARRIIVVQDWVSEFARRVPSR